MQIEKKIPTVLCVDDQHTDRQLLHDLFQTNNFDVLTAENWPDAKILLHSNEVDVVILDYRLIQANAVDIAIEVRKSRPRVPIMLLSGFLADVPEYFKRAVDGCVSKSSPLADWVDTAKSLCNGGEGTSSGRARAV
jgi:response regulator RpfG family c-di-GMP phosphodiesterase